MIHRPWCTLVGYHDPEDYEHEPLDPARLHGVPGLLATPHSAFYSEAALTESQTKSATQVVKSSLACTGLPGELTRAPAGFDHVNHPGQRFTRPLHLVKQRSAWFT